jgi:hypothetical protein
MTTPLEKELKRELDLQGQQFTLTISPEGLRIVPKGKRNGIELRWQDLVSGDAALSVALNASLNRVAAFPEPLSSSPRRAAKRSKRRM